MASARNTVLTATAAALAAAAVAVIGYHAWRDLPLRTPSAAPPQAAAPPLASSSPAASVRANPASPAPQSPSAASPAAPAKEAARRPSFDIVRVEPSGATVVAGRAAPGASVALLDRGAVVAHAKADAAGQFALLPPPLAPGAHQLALSTEVNGRTLSSKQSVTVAVPQRKGAGAVVALAAPGQPTKVLSDSAAPAASKTSGAPAPAASAAPKSQVYIRSVEASQGGGFFASGAASPGAKLELYVNNSPVTSVTADKNGRWSLRVARGLTPGSYSVRADAIDPATGRVLSRAEVPFKFRGFAAMAAAGPQSGSAPSPSVASASQPAPATAPSAVAAARSKQAASPATPVQGGSAVTPAASPANAVIVELPTVRVTRGDNLWRISRKIFGRGIRYTLIYEANANQIRNRNLIYPGQIFVVPKG